MYRNPQHRTLYREVVASRADGVPAPRMYSEVIRYGAWEDLQPAYYRWKPKRVLRRNSKNRKSERQFKFNDSTFTRRHNRGKANRCTTTKTV